LVGPHEKEERNRLYSWECHYSSEEGTRVVILEVNLSN